MSKVIMAMLLSAASAQAGLSKLEALGMIESGNNDAAVGSMGEVSRFQIRPHVWREYSSTRSWRDIRVSAGVAQQYLADLEETFRRRAKRDATDFDLYVLWNAGPSYYAKIGFSQERVHPVIRERAQRYVNLRQMKNPIDPPPAPPPALAVAAPSAAIPTAPAGPSLAHIISAPTPSHETSVVASVMPGLTTTPVSQSIPAGRSQSTLLWGGGIRGR